MHRFLKTFEESQIKKIKMLRGAESKKFDSFSSGDKITVSFRVVDGDSSRIQSMTGVVIRMRNNMSSSTFAIKNIIDQENSYTKTFMLYSPMIESITLVKRGKVRRSKLYYLNKLYGKSARIKEKA